MSRLFYRFTRCERRAVRWASVPALASLIALAVPAMVRAQEPVDTFQVQGWTGGARLDARTRAFRECAVSTSYGGVDLGFTLDPKYEFRIEIGSDDWRLKAGGDYVATLMIDNHEPLQIIASARSDKSIVAEFGTDEDFMKELREGLFLRVLAEHIGISFSLSGSSQALQQLRNCVNTHRGSAPAPR
jgi:hypothetical protein